MRIGRVRIAVSNAALLEIEELPGVRPLDRRCALGLYHFAILLPSRLDLSAFTRRPGPSTK